jgi:Spy/CpxP family protein refolding chaperone
LRASLLLLGLLGLFPGRVEAQRFKWWQDEGVSQQIGLTPKQAKKIDDIFNAAMPDLFRAKHELDRLEQELVPYVDSSHDDAGLRDRVESVETARAELNKHRSVMLLRMRRVLTTEQRVKLEALQRERSRKGAEAHGTRTHPNRAR